MTTEREFIAIGSDTDTDGNKGYLVQVFQGHNILNEHGADNGSLFESVESARRYARHQYPSLRIVN